MTSRNRCLTALGGLNLKPQFNSSSILRICSLFKKRKVFLKFVGAEMKPLQVLV